MLKHILALSVSLALCVQAQAHAQTLTLHHRFVGGVDAYPAFVPLGSLEQGAESFKVSLEAPGLPVPADSNISWYQVAVSTTDEDVDAWPKGSTRACFLSSGQTVHITVSTGVDSSVPVALSVKIEGTPRDGACPASSKHISIPETYTLHWTSPVKVQGPNLAPAVPVDPTTGTVAAPVEKTFFQKYWMYLLAAGLVASTLFGDEPPAKK